MKRVWPAPVASVVTLSNISMLFEVVLMANSVSEKVELGRAATLTDAADSPNELTAVTMK